MEATSSSYTLPADYSNNAKSYFGSFAWIAIAVGIIGILGNGIAIAIIAYHRQTKGQSRQVKNELVTNLTVLDLCTSIILVATYSFKLTHPDIFFHGLSGRWICTMIESEQLLWMFLTASTFALEAITLERLLKIVYPMTHYVHFGPRVTYGLIGITWIFPITWQFWLVWSTSLVQNGQCFAQAKWPSQGVLLLHTYATPLITYIIPVVFFIGSYSHMLYTIKRRNQEVNATTQNNRTNTVLSKAQIKVTMTMVLVCSCFVILFTPMKIFYLLVSLKFADQYDQFFQTLTYFSLLIMVFLNSVINPVIYAITLPDFRKVFVKMMSALFNILK